MISPALGLITNISDFDSSFLSPVSTKQQDSRPVCTIVTLHTMMMMPPSLGHLENINGLYWSGNNQTWLDCRLACTFISQDVRIKSPLWDMRIYRIFINEICTTVKLPGKPKFNRNWSFKLLFF